MTFKDLLPPLLSAHPNQSGAYVLDKGEESLLARAWLVDHAAETIDVQYFIWSDDNIGNPGHREPVACGAAWCEGAGDC